MERTDGHFDTIVVGAGISGLACAQRLIQHDKWQHPGKLCVLEARDRIGGRIESVKVNGSRLDTGANWIHGIGTSEHPNPLMDILPDKRVRALSGSVVFHPGTRAPTPPTSSKKSLLDAEDWTQLSKPRSQALASPKATREDLVIPSAAAGELMGAMWGTIGALHEVAHEGSSTTARNTTVLKAITDIPTFREAFETLDPGFHQTLRGLPQFIENIEAAPLAAVSAEHDQDAPGMSMLEYRINDFDGDQVFLQDGYTAVVEEVAKELLARQLVHTGVEITQISWDQHPMRITTSSGAEYTATDIVCTLPLGVLKNGQSSLFEPKLPPKKLDAIVSLGFGTLDKVFLVYHQPWWNSEPFKAIIRKGLAGSPVAAQENDVDTPDFFIGFTNALAGLEIHEDGTCGDGPRVLSLTNLHNLTGYPVLSCFTSCANAQYIESLSEHQAEDLLHTELTRWLGHEPPRPQAVHATRWGSEPFSKGSYTHMITGLSESKHREEFQRPLSTRNGSTVRFAGEHTSSDHFATVHGALISGRDAAEAIIKHRITDT